MLLQSRLSWVSNKYYSYNIKHDMLHLRRHTCHPWVALSRAPFLRSPWLAIWIATPIFFRLAQHGVKPGDGFGSGWQELWLPFARGMRQGERRYLCHAGLSERVVRCLGVVDEEEVSSPVASQSCNCMQPREKPVAEAAITSAVEDDSGV